MKPFREDGTVVADFSVAKTGFHGDVIVERFDGELDFDSLPKAKEPVLAYGEHTGHLHQLFGNAVDLREAGGGIKYLRLLEPATLKHQEHVPVILPPGTYKIGTQKMFDHLEKRIKAVVD